MFHLDITYIIGFAAVAMCWALSVVLFRVGPRGSVARKLAVLLVVEGFVLITNVVYLYLLEPSVNADMNLVERWLGAINTVHWFGDCAMLVLYPSFLAAALNTKLTRPFAGKRLRMFILLVSVTLFLSVQFSLFEVAESLFYATLSILFTYAMVASIHAWWVAAPGIARNRARSFALAFSFRDICWGFVYGATILEINSGSFLTAGQLYELDLIYRLGTLVYVPIIAYGILRSQMFDIDLRIRWTIKQSTVASVFIAVMFIVSEGASQVLSDELGNVTGLLAAGVLMFFLTPLQRFAERVASNAMPNTKDTPEYAIFRKMQVYESALTDAQHVDGISGRERTLLVHLRDSLGISEADAEAMELDLQARLVS